MVYLGLQYYFYHYDETTDAVWNTVSSTQASAAYELYYTNSQADSAQSNFQVYSDKNFGMQYSGQYSFHSDSSNSQVLNGRNFFIHMWFWTCITDSFVILSIQEYDGSSESTASDSHFLSIGVQGDGYVYIELRMIDNGAYVHYREKTTTLKVEEGWNYIALDVDEIYEYSYITMFHRSSSTGSPYYTKYETYFRGYYDEGTDDDSSTPAKALVLGCKNYYDFTTTITDASPYGLCMKGWIHQIEAWTVSSTWGSVWSSTSTTSSSSIATTVLGWINCGTSNKFCNSRYASTFTSRSSITITDFYFDTIEITDTRLFSWDSSSSSINSQTLDSQSRFTCVVDLTSGNTYNPFYQPSIGRITFNKTNYFKCQIKQKTSGSLLSFFPAMFTIEAWFRLDPIDLRPNGYVSQVFAVYYSQTKDYVLGIGLSNTFLRVYLDDTIHDMHYLFNETTDRWHYVAVSYSRLFEREVTLQIFLDDTMILSSRVFDWHNFDSPNTDDYYLHIGRNFPGVVRKAKINSRSYCLNSKSLWIETDESNCNKKGDYDCDFCDIDETGSGSTYNCFYTCDDFGYYIDNSGSCTECHDSCRYCKSDDAKTDCYLCNSTAYWVQDIDKGYTYTSTTGGNRIQCKCSQGTVSMDGDSCSSCDERCATCNHILNVDCDMCADGAYKVYKSECSYKCPENYIKDDKHHICNFDHSLLNKPEKPQDPQGCIDGYYYNWETMNCSACYYTCLTCEFSSGNCLSCPEGRYLSYDGKCQICETLFSNVMKVGTTGGCIENCGDGKNYGLMVCDDGNIKNGDGCSSKCLPEKDFMCFGGYPTGKDQCAYIPTEIVGATVNKHNDIIIEFSRPIYFPWNRTITNADLKLTYKSVSGSIEEIEYNPLNFNLPANYLYLRVSLNNDINGGAYKDNLVLIQYQNTGTIFDVNGREVKKSTYARIWLNSLDFFKYIDKINAENYAKYILGFAFGGISFWLTISILTNKTIMPALYLFLGLQQFFYIACQDLFLDQKTRYFFSFFRIFRLEHPKVYNIFLEENIIDLSFLYQERYNKNLYYLDELLYHNFHINNNIKIYIFIAYFFSMPIVIFLDFVMTQCAHLKFYKWMHEKIAVKYFFAGPLMLLLFFIYPMGVSLALELRFNYTDNDFQKYSFATCCALSLIFFMYQLCLWIVVFTHYKYNEHLLVIEKFNFLFKPMKSKIFQQMIIPALVTKRLASLLLMVVLCKNTVGPLIIQAFFQLSIVLYMTFFRPFKQFINNFTVFVIEMWILVSYIECIGFTESGSDKSDYFWIMIGTSFGVVLLIDFGFIILGWFKMSGFFYVRRFGQKRQPLIRINRGQLSKKGPQPMHSQHNISNEVNVSEFDFSKIENEIIVDTQEGQGTEGDQSMQNLHQQNLNSASGQPLFKLSELKNIKNKELKRYQDRDRIKKPNDSEQDLDFQLGDFEDYQEQKKDLSRKPRKPKKKKSKAADDAVIDDFQTPGQKIKDLTTEIVNLDDDINVNDIDGDQQQQQHHHREGLPSFGRD